MEHDLSILSDWFKANKLTLITNKSVSMFFNYTNREIKLTEVTVNKAKSPYVKLTKFLGVWIDCKLNWNIHVEKVLAKMHQSLGMLKRSKNMLPTHGKKILYYAQVFSHLHYGISIWGPMCSKKQIKSLNDIENKCIKEVGPTQCADLITVSELIELECYKFGYKLVNKMLPENLEKLSLTNACGKNLEKTHHYHTRKKHIPNLPSVKNNQYVTSILFQGIRLYRILKSEILNSPSLPAFVRQCKKEILHRQ